MTGPGIHVPGTDSFTYAASDGVSTSSPATATLTVSAGAPVANNDTYQTLENHQLFVDGAPVLANDYSPDNMPLQSIQLTQPSHGTATLTTSGTITYTPNNNYVGSDSFTYDDSDGSLTSNIATITINVKASDTAPTAANLNYTLAHGTSLSTDSSSGLLSGANDSDGDTLLPVSVSGPKDGTLQLTNYGDGSFTYTPNAGFFGTDSFTFQVSDGISTSNTATVTLTVTNDTPTANPESYSVLANSPTSVSAANGVLANDSDGEGDALTAVLVSQPAHGNVTLNSDGSFTFHPFGFTGTDSFTYEAYDGVNYSSPTTVTLVGNPVAAAQAYSATHDQTLSVDATDGLLNGTVDADGDTLTASMATGASHGTVTVNNDGSFTYTPTTHYTGTDTFTYTVSDGTNISAPATVTIDITDDVPTVNPQSWDTPENTALSVNAANGVLASSSDDDGDSLTAQLVGGTSNGIVQLGSDGAISYTPNTGFFGTDSFTYDVTDGVSISAPATVTITVDEIIPENLQNSVYSAVTTADFNNDGNPDVAVADQGLNTVSVFLDDSSGVISATPISTTAVGTAPVALAAANFGNGQQDLAVANSGSNTVSILLGNGDGTFTAGTTLTGFNDPVAVVAGNFGNGQQDLAVVNKGNNTVSILLGNGNGTFTAGASLTTGSSPTSIAASDFNNDSKLDLVVTNYASNTVSVFLGNGNGTFQSALTDAVGTAPMSVTTGDFNGDGNADVAVTNSGSNNVSVLLGNGDGTFQAAASYAVGNDPVSIATGNIDGNGYLDLSVANQGDNTLSDLINYGNGEFFKGEVFPAASKPISIAVADFNRDGLTDQVVSLADPKLLIKRGEYNAHAIFRPTGPVAVSFNGYAAAPMNSQDGLVNIVKYWSLLTGVQGSQVLNSSVLGGGNALAPINTVAFSPDGNYLAMYSQLADNIVVWDFANNRAINLNSLPAKSTVISLAFSQDSKMLAAGVVEPGNTGQLYVWDNYHVTKPSFVTLLGKDSPAQQVFFATNMFSVDSRAVIWYKSKAPNQIQASIGATGGGSMPLSSIVSAARSPNKFLAVGNSNSSVDLYAWNGGKALGKPLTLWKNTGLSTSTLPLAFPDDEHLLALSLVNGELWKNQINIVNITDGKIGKQFTTAPPGGGTRFTAMAYTIVSQGAGVPKLQYVVAPAIGRTSGAVYVYSYDSTTMQLTLKYTLR